MSHRLSIFAVFVSVVVGLTLSSCGSSRKVTTGASAYKGKGGGKSSVVVPPSVNGLDPVAKTLIHEAESWLGTPYKYGGNDRGGVDCSGFVTQVYLRALDIKLPRTSREQCEFCQRVDRSGLIPGDLLFFRTTKGSDKVSHVGIFVGENKMIHSSTSQGVIFTDLNSDYYVRTYAGAGKVGQYHAKLSRKQKSSVEKNDKKAPKKSPNEALPHEIPTEIPSEEVDRIMRTASSVKSAPASVQATTESSRTPSVATKSVKKNTSAPAPKPVTTQLSTAGGKKVVANNDASSQTEPSVEDARSSVLNSIKEKDL